VRQEEPPPTLGVAARSGARWQATAQILDGALAIATLIVFARLVSPREFGAVALLVVIASLLTTVVSGPIGNAIVVLRLSERRALSTAWWTALLPSLAFAIVWSAIALAVEPPSFLVAALALSMLIPLYAASSVTTSIQQQRLDFRKLALVRMIAVVGATAAGLGVGVLIQGLAGLIVRQMAIPLLQCAGGSAAARWVPSLTFDRSVGESIRRYVRGLAGFNLLNQVLRRGDDLLVASVLGATSLGYYSLAYRVIELPMAQIGQMSQNVSLPALTVIDDLERFRASFLRIQKVLVCLVAPLGICAMFLGDVAVTTLLGERWAAAGPIVQVFGAIAIIQAADTHIGLIFLARGATDKLFRYGLYWTPPFLACILIGLRWGSLGVAWSYLAFNAVVFYPSWVIAGRVVDLRAREVLRSLAVVFGCAGLIAAVGGVLRVFVDLSGIEMIVAAAALASAAYWGGVLLLDQGLRADVLALVRRPGRAVKREAQGLVTSNSGESALRRTRGL
jgi:O-antigen/teichoic acid export membrane protein